MSTFYEIHCDVLADGHAPGNILVARCWTNRGEGPAAWAESEARAIAKERGWTRRRQTPSGRWIDVCPGCKDATPGGTHD